MRALLLVDLQNDFFLNGSLAVKYAESILPVVESLLNAPFDLIIATKDWHPPHHQSFYSEHPGKIPGDIVEVKGVSQRLWPPHCIEGSFGSDFVEGFDVSKIDHIIYKGTNLFIDSYSAFFDNAHEQSTGLKDYLVENSVKEVYILGVATDYCVKYSVLDALGLGFCVYVICDACQGVNLTPADSKEAFTAMENAGAVLLFSHQVRERLCDRKKEI